MLKKMIALLLALAVMTALLAGCGAARGPDTLPSEEIQGLTSHQWLSVTEDYLREMLTRWGCSKWEELDRQRLEMRLPYIRWDGEAVIAEIFLVYRPNEAMLADGLWWGETPRWEGDWCLARRQILINCINGEWQYGGSATDGLDTEDFREFTEAERACVEYPPLSPREQDPDGRLRYYLAIPSLIAGQSEVTVTDLQVTEAALDRFTGLTLGESSREVTVELPEQSTSAPWPWWIPRLGDLVWVASLPTEEEADRIPSNELLSIFERFPSDSAAPETIPPGGVP